MIQDHNNIVLLENNDVKLYEQCWCFHKAKIYTGILCVFTVCRATLIFGPTLNFFITLLVENYLNTIFLPFNVVFDVYKG